MAPSPATALAEHARRAAECAHVPFSGQRGGVALLLSDGVWVPGVRVESASFSLTIPAALNAYTTAVAAERRDIVAVAFSHAPTAAARAFLGELDAGAFHPRGAHTFCARDGALPPPRERLDPLLPEAPPTEPSTGVQQARSLAMTRAVVPASGFPVGCVLTLGERCLPGVNVEPAAAARGAWTHVLCAERNALGTACSYGWLGEAAGPDDAEAALYLSCPNDENGSPCGACRQLLAELLPHAMLWMDRSAANGPECARPADLLPGSFRGAALERPPAA